MEINVPKGIVVHPDSLSLCLELQFGQFTESADYSFGKLKFTKSANS